MASNAATTIGQKTVGTSAVQFTSTTGQSINNGIRLSIPTSGKVYWGTTSGVTAANGVYINGSTEIAPASVSDPSSLWLISDTAAQQVTDQVVGQTITIT